MALSRELAAGNAADADVAHGSKGTHGAGSRGGIPLMYRAADNRQIAAGETSARALLLGR